MSPKQFRNRAALESAEEELRQAETRFRTFADHASDAFFVTDVETGAILDVNRRAYENLGYTREELIAKRCFLLIQTSLDWIRQNAGAVVAQQKEDQIALLNDLRLFVMTPKP